MNIPLKTLFFALLVISTTARAGNREVYSFSALREKTIKLAKILFYGAEVIAPCIQFYNEHSAGNTFRNLWNICKDDLHTIYKNLSADHQKQVKNLIVPPNSYTITGIDNFIRIAIFSHGLYGLYTEFKPRAKTPVSS